MREHIGHAKPLVYEFRDETTGDVIVYNDHGAAMRQLLRSDPKHDCRIVARNVRLQGESRT